MQSALFQQPETQEPKIQEKDPPALHAVDKLRAIRQEMAAAYHEEHSYPWIVAFSGGKDSTLVLHLVFEILAQAKNPQRQVHVVSNDTLVESPLVIDHLDATLEKVRACVTRHKLPVKVVKTIPYMDDTFWVNLIGRGYPPPKRISRWCTDRMKIQPTSTYILGQAEKQGKVIMLLGTRKAESETRKRSIEKFERKDGSLSPHSTLKNCLIYAPIVNLTDQELWMILLQIRPLWGGTHRGLVTMYQNAKGGDCPLVLTKADKPSCGTSSPRFGCWVCTVVNKDRSLEGLVDAGYTEFEKFVDFRDWLQEFGKNRENRMKIRRNGSIKYKSDGTLIPGPFTMKARREILDRLLALQTHTKRCLIRQRELEFIERIWESDQKTYEILEWE